MYEPVTAFPEPLRAIWTAYAESALRPRRVTALGVEHDEAVRRLLAVPPEVAPERESAHAYVRRSGDGPDATLYVCPWEIRLRSWLAFEDFRGMLPSQVAAACVPPAEETRLVAEFERWRLGGRPLRPHILSSTWHVPQAWFVPFGPAERCLLLGGDRAGAAGESPTVLLEGQGFPRPEPGPLPPPGGATYHGPGETPGWGHVGTEGATGPTTASPTRTLIYVTSMGTARRRLDRALRAMGDGLGRELSPGQVERVARWLAEFHADALVELDYGGLVHLLDDRRLRADESVAEVTVALAALERGEAELAVAMRERLLARWRPVRALAAAN